MDLNISVTTILGFRRPPLPIHSSAVSSIPVQLFPKSVGASFERHGSSRVPSFPRKRESSLSVEHFHRPAQWIPACAGMTCASKCILCQMTPPPRIGPEFLLLAPGFCFSPRHSPLPLWYAEVMARYREVAYSFFPPLTRMVKTLVIITSGVFLLTYVLGSLP